MKLGMTEIQMAELYNELRTKHSDELHNIVISAMEKEDNDVDKINAMIWSLSHSVVPSLMFSIIESNNQLISKQIESIIEQLPVILKADEENF